MLSSFIKNKDFPKPLGPQMIHFEGFEKVASTTCYLHYEIISNVRKIFSK
jgi:hypothetical protein